MTDPRGVHSGHLDAATLAALVDRTLDPAARAAAEAHLSTCADCREVWVETSEVVKASHINYRAPRASLWHSRRHTWMYVGGALVAGLAIAVGTTLRPTIGTEEPTMEQLVAATGGRRFAEARTSIELRWQPRPSPVRSSEIATPSQISRIVDHLLEEARDEDSAASLHSAGLANLIVGRPAEAVALLRQASARASDDASMALDLSAALLEKCRTDCLDTEAREALTAAERALVLDPDSASALFNRAIALERLLRWDEARRAWQKALLRQDDPGWRDESAAHIERLREQGEG